MNKHNSIIIAYCSHFNAFIMYSSLSGPFHDSECHQYSATALYCITLMVLKNDSEHIIANKKQDGKEALGRLYVVTLRQEVPCTINSPICRGVADVFEKLSHPVCHQERI